MKVYVVLYDQGRDCSEFIGVYSTRENAEKRVANCGLHKSSYDIEEVLVDED